MQPLSTDPVSSPHGGRLAFVRPLTGVALAVTLMLMTACGGGGNGSSGTAAGTGGSTPEPSTSPAGNGAGLAAAPAGNTSPRTGSVTTGRTGAGSGTTARAGSAARIQFARLEHDFGEITDTETYETSFPFTNTGGSTLIIESIKASCGCTLPTLEKRRYEPGEGGEIEVVFDPKAMKDSKTKKVTVISNAVNVRGGTTELSFIVDIRPLLRLDSRFLQLGRMVLGRENVGNMGITYWDPELEVVEVTCNMPFIDAELVEFGTPFRFQEEPAYRGNIRVTLAEDAPWGSLYSAKLFVKVKGRPLEGAQRMDYDYEAYVQGYLFGDLHAESSSRGRDPNPTSMVSLGPLAAGGRFEASIRIYRPSGAGFTLQSATIVESQVPDVQTRIEQHDASSYQVYVSGSVGNFVGRINGKIKVETDVPGEEEIFVNFIGAVR